jgi:uncharacterized protein
MDMDVRLSPARPFHVMTKPIGPLCNLDCKYCFYLEKEKLYPEHAGAGFRMTDAVLERYISSYITAQPANVPEISFAWQGGEPTLLGVDFFRRVVELQKKYCPPHQRIVNALQTNGTLLDAEWCEFLRENNFLVGLSIDGPREMHDRYRVDKGNRPTFDKVMRGLELLKEHNVEFNTLTVVNRHNSKNPLEVYRFLKKHGSGFMQFIPLVERAGDGTMFASPPSLEGEEAPSPVTPWSVESQTYGDFLCAIFDEWVRHDVGKVFVQLFEVQLGVWMGMPASLCVFSETCGAAMALEHNGDLYSCDHYVYPEYRLGNIATKPMIELVASSQQIKFGLDKRDTLPKYCRTVARLVGRWRYRRRRSGCCLFAADFDSVLLHRLAGRQRLHGARRVYDGPHDGSRRAAWQGLHSAHVELRLRYSRHYGDTHYRLAP